MEPKPRCCLTASSCCGWRLEAGIGQAAQLGLRGEELGDGAAVLLVLLHAQGQRLDAAQDQEALEGRQDAAGGFLHQQKALLMFGLGADQRAAQAVGVAVEELGGRVHDDVRAERDAGFAARAT